MVYATDGRGGGDAMPPYLQGRSGGKPMITPKSTVVPGEVKPKTPFGAIKGLFGPAGLGRPPRPRPQQHQQQYKPAGPTQPAPAITPKPAVPPTPGAVPAVGGKPAPQTLYDFFKQDLEDQQRSAMAEASADASRRGVFYGTPLTTNQGYIKTQYLRGLGQLQADLLQNEQQNEISRLGLAGNLLNSAPMPSSGGIDPEVFKTIGGLFGGSSPVAGARTGPVITPNKPIANPGGNTKMPGAQPWARRY